MKKHANSVEKSQVLAGGNIAVLCLPGFKVKHMLKYKLILVILHFINKMFLDSQTAFQFFYCLMVIHDEVTRRKEFRHASPPPDPPVHTGGLECVPRSDDFYTP